MRSGLGKGPIGQPETSCPLNLSKFSTTRVEEPVLQLAKKSPTNTTSAPHHTMPQDASEALLSLIAKTGRDLEITRKTRRPGETNSSGQRIETSRNFSPIAPEVTLFKVELHFQTLL